MRLNTPPVARQSGFTLVELMISLVLGLVVVGGVISVFLANQQSYRTNQALGDVQDNSRTAFEFLARDIRDAGLTGCGNLGRVANVLNNSPTGGGTDWWANFGNAVMGYDGAAADPAVTTGTAIGQRVAGTDSIQLMGASGSGYTVDAPNSTTAQFKLNETSTDLADGDIVIVCDPNQATILQVTNYNNANVTVVHNTGVGSPGNCSKGLGYPAVCTTTGTPYTYANNAQLAKLTAVDWYIGNYNTTGGRSLFRMSVAPTGGVPAATPQEMVRNVTDMQITYLVKGAAAFVAASGVAATDWANITAVQLTLWLQSTDQRAGTNVQPLTRQYTTTVTLRNRVK
ncbi:MAG: PilW family protein [Halothiobacillus sp.]